MVKHWCTCNCLTVNLHGLKTNGYLWFSVKLPEIDTELLIYSQVFDSAQRLYLRGLFAIICSNRI